MSPSSKPRLYYGHFYAAKFDFTALLAKQHVKTTVLPQAPLPRSYDDAYHPVARQLTKKRSTMCC